MESGGGRATRASRSEPRPRGEFELIERAREALRAVGAETSPTLLLGSGDDAAVVSAAGASVVTVDALVEGIHFRRETAPLRSIGHKAMAAALSDIAAMGAEAAEAYVVVGLPADLDEAGRIELLDGLAAAASRWSCAIAGGDVSRAGELFLAVTVVGRLDDPDDAVRRDGAVPGQLVALTGELGGAAAGLVLLERPEVARGLSEAVAEGLRRRQLEPSPRLAAGRALAAAGATAMIDISDGLGADAGHVGKASEATLRIELERVPLAPGVAEVARAVGSDPFELALAGGEDYELLVCFAPESETNLSRAASDADVALTVVGRVEPADSGEGVRLADASGADRAAVGYDHLRDAPGDP